MFTGLIEETGSVSSVKDSADGREITISARRIFDGIKKGDSIALNGACQTVTAFSDSQFTVFASKITCSLTNLGEFKPGMKVNLERAATPLSRLGGHLVQGHVDGTGKVASIKRDTKGITIKVSAPEDFLRYIIDRGSVAVDGISLTVVKKDRSDFSLYIIPETAENTTVNEWTAGRNVNLEADIIARYVENFLSGRGGGGSGQGEKGLMDSLRENGYV